MTAARFRQLALALPQVSESEHMNHPDFRVGGKIFATLGYPGDDWGMVKLTPEQQAEVCRDFSTVFSPVKGAWGKRGCTGVKLAESRSPQLRPVLKAAWANIAPRSAKGGCA
jgi:hypothetical protein